MYFSTLSSVHRIHPCRATAILFVPFVHQKSRGGTPSQLGFIFDCFTPVSACAGYQSRFFVCRWPAGMFVLHQMQRGHVKCEEGWLNLPCQHTSSTDMFRMNQTCQRAEWRSWTWNMRRALVWPTCTRQNLSVHIYFLFIFLKKKDYYITHTRVYTWVLGTYPQPFRPDNHAIVWWCFVYDYCLPCFIYQCTAMHAWLCTCMYYVSVHVGCLCALWPTSFKHA